MSKFNKDQFEKNAEDELCENIPLNKTAGVSLKNGLFEFHFEKESNEDIIKLAAYKLNCPHFKNDIYWFGYKFEDSAGIEERSSFVNYIKGISGNIREDVLRQFIELPLFSWQKKFDTYNVDCFVYPCAERSQLVSKMIGIIGECTQHNISRCSFESVKAASIAVNHLGIPNAVKSGKFESLKGNNILVIDFNTRDSQISEILKTLNDINQDCNIFVYTLICV